MAAISVMLVFSLFLLLLLWQSTKAQISFIGGPSNFSFVNRFGNATIIPDVGIRLTDQTEFVTGSAFYAQPVRLKDRRSVDEILSFSTTFVFTVLPPPDVSQTGDGLVFVIRPNLPDPQKTPLYGLYLGLLDNLTSMGRPENHLFGIEFDMVKNGEFGDINDNHIGVDLNSLSSVESKSAGYWVGNQFVDLDMKSGQNIQAWIDYRHLQKELRVTIAPAGSLRPEKPLISMKNMNLSSIFEENMYVGFSAATGRTIEDNYILAWSFSTNGTAPALDTSSLPSLSRTKSKSKNLPLIVGVATASAVVLVFLVAAAAVVWFKRKKQADVIEEWEVDYWPHRFRYRDLHTATKGFGEEQVIGRGGFGKVYKGVLAANGLEVAVKCILRETREGLKEFIAEISSLGRLQHRNLVPIRGYCRRGKQLFIVYEYMPNGSLDRMIFENPWRVLEWGQRFRILKDVAAGLLYLHEEWEQRVVHRDIKSSNVLLDWELRGKVGDFGLARLYAHDENSQTTRVAGTPGYIAPEVASTGKATPRTDVFSFGVLMLEVACGRRPVNPFPDGDQMVLFDWVLLLYANGRLMDAADPKLGGEFDENEMEIVLKLGVICCNPEPETRPDMTQVVQILEGGASLPGFELHLSFENEMGTPTSMEKDSLSRSTDASCSMSLEAR